MLIPADSKTQDVHGRQEATASPPPYAPSDPSSSSSTQPFVPPDYIKPSNYLSFSKTHDSLRGTYVIDPSLDIPSEYLPPLPDGVSEEARSHFYAKSVHGNVTANLYLLDKPINKSRGKVYLDTSSTHGSTDISVRRGNTVPSFQLKSSSSNGNVTVKIPRSYRGPVTSTTVHGRIWMSKDVHAQAVIFSEVQGVKRFFIGDMSARNDDIDDAMILETKHGNIRVYYEDEDCTPPVVKSVKSFWSKIVG